MLDSVRVRLTLWYSGVLALFLLILSGVSYFVFWRSTLQRTDSDLSELSEAFLTTVRAELQDNLGPDAPKISVQVAIVEHRFRDHVLAVFDANAIELASSEDSPDDASSRQLLRSDAFERFVRMATAQDRSFHNLGRGGNAYRAYSRKFQMKGQPYVLFILRSLRPQQEMLEQVRVTFAWLIPVAILLASLGGYFLARKSLAPVVAMSVKAGRISAANLNERLPVQNARDELGKLARAFNALLERVDRSFERQRQFMSDASHELRTPVAIMRGESEVALSRPERSAEEYRESLAVLHAEAQRLTHIVEDLFTLTRADAGQYPLSPRDFYLDELLTETTHAARSLAAAKDITLTCDAGEELRIRADEALVQRMLLNLLDNAIKYTPRAGCIKVSCERANAEYAVSVSDTGPGIPVDLQDRVFERFFRVDKARSRAENDASAGLGLSIATWIAQAHGGRLILSRSDGTGSTFTAFLPAQPVTVAQAAAAAAPTVSSR